MKDVKFEYLVNGKKVPSNQLTTTTIAQAFGRSEYVVAGTYPEDEEVNEIEVVVKSQREVTDKISMKPCERRGQDPNKRCIPVDGQKDETQNFMNRLWASKRINYLLNEKVDCTRAIASTFGILNTGKSENTCEEEALDLALKYHFVTQLTSLVIEDNDKYVKKGPLPVNYKLKRIQPRVSAISSTPSQSGPLAPFQGTQQFNGPKVDLGFSAGILKGITSTQHSTGDGGQALFEVSSVSSLKLF